MLSRPRDITQLCAGYLWCDLHAVEAGARGCLPSSPVESRCSAEGHSDREDPCLNRRVFDIHQMILFQAQRETKCIYIIASLFLSLAALSSSACASGCTRTCVGFFFLLLLFWIHLEYGICQLSLSKEDVFLPPWQWVNGTWPGSVC